MPHLLTQDNSNRAHVESQKVAERRNWVERLLRKSAQQQTSGDPKERHWLRLDLTQEVEKFRNPKGESGQPEQSKVSDDRQIEVVRSSPGFNLGAKAGTHNPPLWNFLEKVKVNLPILGSAVKPVFRKGRGQGGLTVPRSLERAYGITECAQQ